MQTKLSPKFGMAALLATVTTSYILTLQNVQLVNFVKKFVKTNLTMNSRPQSSWALKLMAKRDQDMISISIQCNFILYPQKLLTTQARVLQTSAENEHFTTRSQAWYKQYAC